MSAFDHYAQYYDLLYKDKDYSGETDFIEGLLRRHGAKVGAVLELGSGTGIHAIEFAKRGWTVDGVDLSPKMVEQSRTRSVAAAQAHNAHFDVGDMRTVSTGKTYAAVVSLFHVMSYQTGNLDLSAAVKTAARHLAEGGLFFFDFWYGPAVLSDPPQVRVKRLENERIYVTRIAEPTLLPQENRVEVRYSVTIKDRLSGQIAEVIETHSMRYLFVPEMLHFLASSGLEACASGTCYGESPLSSEAWYGWILARRGTGT